MLHHLVREVRLFLEFFDRPSRISGRDDVILEANELRLFLVVVFLSSRNGYVRPVFVTLNPVPNPNASAVRILYALNPAPSPTWPTSSRP